MKCLCVGHIVAAGCDPRTDSQINPHTQKGLPKKISHTRAKKMYVSAGHFGVFFFVVFFYTHAAAFRVGGVGGVSIFMTPTRLGRVGGRETLLQVEFRKAVQRTRVQAFF